MYGTKWIEDQLLRNNLDTSKVNDLYKDFVRETGSLCSLDSFHRYVRRTKKALELPKKQRESDINSYDNRFVKKEVQAVNSVNEYHKEILNILGKVDLSPFRKSKHTKTSEDFGIISLADLHFNEIILETEGNGNKYDFTVASQRLKKLADRSRKIFKSFNISHVVIAGLGDFLNSDRRMDELLACATNRSKATVLSVYLLEQFLLDLLDDFDISFAMVTGNEARLGMIHEWNDFLTTNNFDFTIFSFLKAIFRNFDNITFLEGDYKEQVLSLKGFNILILHGEYLKDEKTVQSLYGKYSSKGINLDYILYGHTHSTFISDFSARSSSLCGSNAYSNRSLGVMSKASQNIFLLDTKTKTLDSMKIDLQDVSGIEGYDIIEHLENYEAKESTKSKAKIISIK